MFPSLAAIKQSIQQSKQAYIKQHQHLVNNYINKLRFSYGSSINESSNQSHSKEIL